MPRSKLGNKQKLGENKWRVRVTVGRRTDGKPRIISKTVYGTEKDADREIQALAVRLRKNEAVGDNMQLGAYFERVFIPVKREQTVNATVNTYIMVYKNHIKDQFGSRRLSDISDVEIQDYILSFESASMARKTASVLRTILRSAWADGLIDQEPMRHALSYPKAKKEEPKMVWNAQMVREAMKRLEGVPLEPVFLLMAGAGLRREEAIAVCWEDITLNGQGQLFVYVNKAKTDYDGVKETKTKHSVRTVVVPEPFASRLEELRGVGEVYPYTAHSIQIAWRRLFNDGKELAGMLYIPISRLRHTHETLMQLAGVSDTVNAALHGRSNVNTGYQHYLMPSTDTYQGAGDVYSRLFSV